MKLIKKMAPAALATSMMAAGFMAPGVASAEIGYNAAIANMYLWRGQDVSAGGAVLSGGVDYSHESGAYASLWASTGNSLGSSVAADLTPGYEFDVILGYGGEAGDLGYDISYWRIAYPQASGSYGEELIIGLSFMGVDFSYVDNLDSDSDYGYYTLGYSMDKYSIMYGADITDDAEYSHVDFSYAATDELSFTISKASDDTAGVAEDSLILVSYSLPL